MSNGILVKDIFDMAIAAESGAGELYAEFAKLFSHVPAASDFWKKMSEDEFIHKARLYEIYVSFSEEQKNSFEDNPLFKKAEQFVRGISITKILASVRCLDDAYETAYALEYSEINAVMQFIVSRFVPSDERSSFLLSNLEDHIGRIESFSKTVFDHEARLGIQAIK